MNQELIDELTRAYWMELEAAINFISSSTNLVGAKADPIKQALAADVAEETQHAQDLARRIHIIGGTIPGSMQFSPVMKSLQPGDDPTDVLSVIRGVIETEGSAVAQYKKIIKMCGDDPVTEDLCVRLLADEEEHLRLFQGYLMEYERA